MANIQKFKRGNLVRISKDLGQSMSHFKSDTDAIVMYTYSEKYGGGDTDSYCLMFPFDGHTSSWYREHQLTLIDEGGEHLIKEAEKKRDEISEQSRDLNFIISKWDERGSKVYSGVILFLFEKIGFKSSFIRNGEFGILFADWLDCFPLFDLIIKSNDFEQVSNQLNNKLPSDIRDKIFSFWTEVKSIQAGGVILN